MNLKSKIALAALSLIASTAAFSQSKAPEPDYTWAFNVGAVSDYRFRGIEQSAGGPSVQGGIDFSHKSGFYAGTFLASNIKWIKEFNGASKGDYEVDLYGGFKNALSNGIGYDVGVITYQYPGNDSGGANTLGGSTNYTKADTTEAYVGVSYGVASLKYSHSMGDFLGNKDTSGSRYWDLSANFDVGNGFTLTPHFGFQYLPRNSTSNPDDLANYGDYSLTLAKDFGNGVVVSLAAIGTNANRNFYTSSANFGNARYYGNNTLVLGVKYNF
jgi:uncharacterized protein (TIGR02001 family)